jgi:chromosome segregation ATPase
MKKAFDANVPKFRPRLRGNAPAAVADATATPPATSLPVAPEEAPLAAPEPQVKAEVAEPAARAGVAEAEPTELDAGAVNEPALIARQVKRATLAQVEPVAAAAVAPEQSAASSDLESRRDRLERVRRKVAEAVRPVRIEAPPQDPSQAGQSALALVRELEARLGTSRELEEALRVDLSAARAEAARSATEARGTAERLGAVETQLGEKQAVLAEMLQEMNALEEERDEAVERAQTLAGLDEERQRLLDELSRRAEEAEKALAESRQEGEKLSEELDARLGESARLRAALAEVTRERDGLAREAVAVRRERDELAEAKRALEQVHQALSQARARLG